MDVTGHRVTCRLSYFHRLAPSVYYCCTSYFKYIPVTYLWTMVRVNQHRWRVVLWINPCIYSFHRNPCSKVLHNYCCRSNNMVAFIDLNNIQQGSALLEPVGALRRNWPVHCGEVADEEPRGGLSYTCCDVPFMLIFFFFTTKVVIARNPQPRFFCDTSQSIRWFIGCSADP